MLHVMGLRDMFRGRETAVNVELPVLPWPRDDFSWIPAGWQDRQRELQKAAKALGYLGLEPGEHTPDEAVLVALQDQGPRLPLLVTLAGQIVGTVPGDEHDRVRRKVRSKGAQVNGYMAGGAHARLYHWEHGRWGVVVYA